MDNAKHVSTAIREMLVDMIEMTEERGDTYATGKLQTLLLDLNRRRVGMSDTTDGG